LSNISFAVNYYLGAYDVTGYHVVNIIIHLINGILVYFLSMIIFKQLSHIPDQKIPLIQTGSIPLMSLFAALIFITHPIQTQSVTYIVQRMNSMAVMFYLLSFLLYIYGRISGTRWKRWVLFCGCFASWIMALGSKEIAGTLPFIIFLYEWYFIQDLRIEWIRRNIKYFFLLFFILVLVGFIYMGKSPFDRILSAYDNREFSMFERVLTQFRVMVFYISLLFFPHPSRLNLLHHITASHSLFAPLTTLFSLLIIVGLTGLAIFLYKKRRLISFCILWFFINLVIESSVIGLEMIYEHRLYLPMFAFSLLLAYLLFALLSKKQFWAVAISVIIILSLGTFTYMRNRVWQDEITLWSNVISKNPQSHRAHNNLGVVLNMRGRIDEAIDHFLKALRLKLNYVEAHYNLGSALEKQGRIDEAISHYLETLRVKPDFEIAHFSLGNALERKGHIDKAIDHYFKALLIKPRFLEAHYNLGNALKKQGRIDEAISHYLEALRIKPDFEIAHNNLGIVLIFKGNIKEAIYHFREALAIKPDYVNAENNLKKALKEQQRCQ
jgi:tetratricopeptide (TPR) repeat protein